MHRFSINSWCVFTSYGISWHFCLFSCISWLCLLLFWVISWYSLDLLKTGSLSWWKIFVFHLIKSANLHLASKNFLYFLIVFLTHSWLISGSWSRSILLPWQNKRNPVWVLRPRPQSTTNHATSSFESNCFCQLNPICQHDFGSIFWQSPGGIQLFQELVKNHFIVPFRPFVCRWDQKAVQANVDLACAQQQNFATSAVCATEVGMACLFWQSHAHVQKNLERLKQTPVVYASKIN